MEIVKRWRHIKSQRERGLLGPGKDCYLHQIVESFRDKVFFFPDTMLPLSLFLTHASAPTLQESFSRQCDNMLVGHDVHCTTLRNVSLSSDRLC